MRKRVWCGLNRGDARLRAQRCSRRRWLEKLRRSAQSATSLDPTPAVIGIPKAEAAQPILSPESPLNFRI